jgi:hypothetical protein
VNTSAQSRSRVSSFTPTPPLSSTPSSHFKVTTRRSSGLYPPLGATICTPSINNGDSPPTLEQLVRSKVTITALPANEWGVLSAPKVVRAYHNIQGHNHGPAGTRTSLIVDIQATNSDTTGAETRAARAASAIASAIGEGVDVLVVPNRRGGCLLH